MIYTVPEDAAGERLDAWISGAADISRSRAQKLIEEGGILRNGKPADKKDKVAPGDEITVNAMRSRRTSRSTSSTRTQT